MRCCNKCVQNFYRNLAMHLTETYIFSQFSGQVYSSLPRGTHALAWREEGVFRTDVRQTFEWRSTMIDHQLQNWTRLPNKLPDFTAMLSVWPSDLWHHLPCDLDPAGVPASGEVPRWAQYIHKTINGKWHHKYVYKAFVLQIHWQMLHSWFLVCKSWRSKSWFRQIQSQRTHCQSLFHIQGSMVPVSASFTIQVLLLLASQHAIFCQYHSIWMWWISLKFSHGNPPWKLTT